MSAAISDSGRAYVTCTVAEQVFGISVHKVRDVLRPCRVTPVPLAPPEVAGSLNLRGRVVTAVDLRVRLGLPPRLAGASCMNIVVEHGGELYSLMVDSVGEVLTLPEATAEPNPPALDAEFRAVSDGIHRLDGQLLIALDVDRLLDTRRADAA